MQTQTIEDDELDVNLLEEFRNFTRVDRSWMVHAACRGLHPDLFHPTVSDMQTQKTAMTICNGDQRSVMNRKTRRLELVGTPPCPVKDRCFEYIMSLSSAQDVGGVYAGMSHRTRKTLRRKREKTVS